MGRRLKFLRSLRTAIVSSNIKPDNKNVSNSIMLKPLVNDKGRNVIIKDKFNKHSLVKGRKPNFSRKG